MVEEENFRCKCISLTECHESIKKFYYNKSRETYFTDYDVGNGHVKLCWKKTSDIIEAHECTSTTYGFSEREFTSFISERKLYVSLILIYLLAFSLH